MRYDNFATGVAMQAEIDELRKENKRLNSSNESYITLANTAYEISSTLRTENERLRSALHNAVSMIDSLNSAYGSDDVDAVAQAGRAALGGGGGGGVMMNLPKLYFKKVHKTTGVEFVDYFSPQNCSDWCKTPLDELHMRAGQRIKHWNECLADWDYSIVGWNVEGLEP